jgi:nucleoside-diphosphate-sugar epimerase
MVENCVFGAGGFIGKHLVAKLPKDKTVSVHHGEAYDVHVGVVRAFYLSAYGNRFGQGDIQTIVEANVIEPVKAAMFLDCDFIFVSSSSVNLPVQTPYSLCKAAAEKALLALIEAGYWVFIARPYSVTGVGEQREHLIPTLIRSCLDGEPMKLDPHATHDFIDADDFVDGLVKLTELDVTGIYEFGSCKATTNLEVLRVVERVTGKKAVCEFTGRVRPYDGPDWCCKDRSLRPPGWEPRKTLETSIAEMVEMYAE